LLALRNQVLNGGLPEWPMGADCKSAGLAFSGSNPLPTTSFLKSKISLTLIRLQETFSGMASIAVWSQKVSE
jgi:hypothetical protein